PLHELRRIWSALTRCRHSERKAITAGTSAGTANGFVSLPGPASSHHWHWAGVLGGNGFGQLWRQGELKHGPPRFIRAGPQSSPVRLDDRTADRQAHAYAAGLRRVEGREQGGYTSRARH